MQTEESRLFSELIRDRNLTLMHDDRGSCIILWAPYLPTEANDPATAFVDGYYLVYQQLYRRKKELHRRLEDSGIEVRDYTEPYKYLLLRTGLCTALRNRLLCHREFGSFFAVEILYLPDRREGEPFPLPDCNGVPATDPRCEACGLCAQRCPVGALCESGGLTRERCIRDRQFHVLPPDDPDGPAIGNRVLGCNVCQRVCPRNSGIDSRPLDDAERTHFALDRFLQACLDRGDKWQWYDAYIGHNYARTQRLLSFLLNAMKNHNPLRYREVVSRYAAHQNPEIRDMIAAFLRYCDRLTP